MRLKVITQRDWARSILFLIRIVLLVSLVGTLVIPHLSITGIPSVPYPFTIGRTGYIDLFVLVAGMVGEAVRLVAVLVFA
jgi:hypothetical protein